MKKNVSRISGIIKTTKKYDKLINRTLILIRFTYDRAVYKQEGEGWYEIGQDTIVKTNDACTVLIYVVWLILILSTKTFWETLSMRYHIVFTTYTKKKILICCILDIQTYFSTFSLIFGIFKYLHLSSSSENIE